MIRSYTSAANIYSAPRIGLVVGTFAAVPYVHLQLESWRRHYRDTPLLIHDDGSPFARQLAELCSNYGAGFSSNPLRLRQTVGDLSAMARGFDWAERLGPDVLVKMSRRFVPLHNWGSGLQALALESRMPTFSQECNHFNFGFRTECVAFDCRAWRESGGAASIRAQVERNKPIFVEGFIHQLARAAARSACPSALAYMAAHPRAGDRDGYAPWRIMPDRRTMRSPGVLWHDCDGPLDYCRIARAWGLRYSIEDFEDPNQGCGLGEP